MSSHEIEFTDKIIPDAYHGTNNASAEAILRSGFKKSFGEKQYMGDGVYFFEAAKTYAAEWAQRRYGAESVVVRAIINLGYCLDLHVPEYVSLVSKYAVKLREEARRRNHGRDPKLPITDAHVINLIAIRVEVDTIRGVFIPSQQKIFFGSHFRAGQLIICVRNLERILSVTPA
jgi:hypothetical protein